MKNVDGLIQGTLAKTEAIAGALQTAQTVGGNITSAPSTVERNYNKLDNKPSINAVTVEGDKTGADYKLQSKMDTLSQTEIERILYVG